MVKEAKTIEKLNLGLDLIISSPLTRAIQTAEIVADYLDSFDILIEDERLEPGFSAGDLSEILDENPEVEAVMLVGHEPDFSLTIERIIGGGSIVCKKGSLARVDLTDAGVLSGELIWLLPPKLLVK
jgi:phosphohistidine phosphatase